MNRAPGALRWLPLLCVGSLAVACGGQLGQEPPKEPPRPRQERKGPLEEGDTRPTESPPNGTQGQQTPDRRTRPPPQQPPGGMPGGMPGGAEKQDFSRWEGEITSALASGVCGNACRALASMGKSVEQLCNQAEAQDDQSARARCEEARKRLQRAKAKVVKRCGACAERAYTR